MKVFILRYKYNANTIAFNVIAKDEEKVELFTKRSELWGRIEHISSSESIYHSYSDIEYYEMDLNTIDKIVVDKN